MLIPALLLSEAPLWFGDSKFIASFLALRSRVVGWTEMAMYQLLSMGLSTEAVIQLDLTSSGGKLRDEWSYKSWLYPGDSAEENNIAPFRSRFEIRQARFICANYFSSALISPPKGYARDTESVQAAAR